MTEQDLEQHQWKERIIIVSSPEFGNAEAEKQIAMLRENLNDLKERKGVVYQITNHGYIKDFGWGIDPTDKNNKKIDNFKVSLIGLDGTEKYTSETAQSASKFCEIIDAMPMRKDEMRENE